MCKFPWKLSGGLSISTYLIPNPHPPLHLPTLKKSEEILILLKSLLETKLFHRYAQKSFESLFASWLKR